MALLAAATVQVWLLLAVYVRQRNGGSRTLQVWLLLAVYVCQRNRGSRTVQVWLLLAVYVRQRNGGPRTVMQGASTLSAAAARICVTACTSPPPARASAGGTGVQ